MIDITLKLLNILGFILNISGSLLIALAINKSKGGIRFNLGDGPLDPVFLTKPGFFKYGLGLIILGFILQFAYTVYSF